MTEKRRAKHKFRSLKTALVIGTVGITMVGTRVAGQLDAVANNSEPSITVVRSAQTQERFQLSPNINGSNSGAQLQLQAMPRVIIPRIGPIARTRSSR